MFVGQKYRFYLGFYASNYAWEQVFPINDKLVFTNEKKEFKESRKLTTKLLFDKLVFDKFLLQERSVNNKKLVEVLIETTFDDGLTWDVCHLGYIRLVDCQFNISKCLITCEVIEKDSYECLNKNAEKEVKLSALPVLPVELAPFLIAGQYELVSCNQALLLPPGSVLNYIIDSCINANEGWTEISTSYSIGSSDPVTGDTTYYFTTQWGRVKSVGSTMPTSGSNWIQIGGDWYRPLDLGEITSLGITTSPTAIDTLNYSYKLNWILEYFGGAECWDKPSGTTVCADGSLGYCTFNVVSNFFTINPDGTNPDNEVYQDAISKFANLFLLQKSDVLRSRVANIQPSTPVLTFKKLMDDLRTTFDVHFYIDKSITNYVNPNPNHQHLNNMPVLRIEHRSYFEEKLMLDLTQAQFTNDINGKQEYSYLKSKLPQSEVWKWQAQTDFFGDFDSGKIKYDENAADRDLVEEVYQCSIIMTNIQYLLDKSNYISDETNENEYEGFCLVATVLNSNKFYLTQEIGVVSNKILLNNALSFANLLRKYHRYNRPFKDGDLNGLYTIFKTTKAARQQVPLQISMSREDYFTKFRAIDKVKTQFGWGTVDSANYEEPTQQLTIQVSH